MKFKEQQGLTYMQIKGTGLANTCPLLDDASESHEDPGPDGEHVASPEDLDPGYTDNADLSQQRGDALLSGGRPGGKSQTDVKGYYTDLKNSYSALR